MGYSNLKNKSSFLKNIKIIIIIKILISKEYKKK